MLVENKTLLSLDLCLINTMFWMEKTLPSATCWVCLGATQFKETMRAIIRGLLWTMMHGYFKISNVSYRVGYFTFYM